MKYYLIYQITNLVNNKIYIGKHMTDDLNDGYMGSGSLIKRAENKYGLDKFEKEILFECSSEEEMNKKEAEIVNEEFIARLDTYNITLGGNGGWNYINSFSKTKKHKFKCKCGFSTYTIGKYAQHCLWCNKCNNKQQILEHKKTCGWCRGLSKETDIRVLNKAKKLH